MGIQEILVKKIFARYRYIGDIQGPLPGYERNRFQNLGSGGCKGKKNPEISEALFGFPEREYRHSPVEVSSGKTVGSKNSGNFDALSFTDRKNFVRPVSHAVKENGRGVFLQGSPQVVHFTKEE